MKNLMFGVGSFSFQRIPRFAFYRAQEGSEGGGGVQAPLEGSGGQEGGNPAQNVASGDQAQQPKESALDFFSDSSRRGELEEAFTKAKSEDDAPKTKQKAAPEKKEETESDELPPIPGDDLPKPKEKKDDGVVEELEAIQPSNLKGKAVNDFVALKKKSSEIIRTEREARKKAEGSLSQLSQKHEQEKAALQKEIDELRGYRTAVDIHGDPDFQSKYLSPVNTVKKGMITMLKDMGITDSAIEGLDWESAQELEQVQAIIAKKSETQARLFGNKLVSYLDAMGQMREQVENARKNHKELIKQRELSQQTSKVNAAAKIDQTLKSVVGMKGADEKLLYPALNPMEPHEGATPEEIKAIESHNARAKDATDKIQKFASMESPEERVHVATAAVIGSMYARAYKTATIQIQKLQKELEGIAASTGGSNRKVGNDVSDNKAPQKQNYDVSGREALDAAFPHLK